METLELTEENEDTQSESFLLRGIFWLLTAFAFLLFCYVTDHIAFNNRYSNQFYGKEATYKVPSDYQIVSNGKYFAIKVIKGYNAGQYLYHGKYGIEPYYKEVAYDLFLDSANAKAVLKSYLDDKKKDAETLNDFK